MKRVHDKLNILIVCTVVAIAAVGYLLIQTGTIDPSMGAGSGITSIKKAEKYSEKNTIAVELEGEEIQEVLQNEDFMKMIASPEFAKLVESDEFLKVLDDPVFSIVADVMGNDDLMTSNEQEPYTQRDGKSGGGSGGGIGEDDLRQGTSSLSNFNQDGGGGRSISSSGGRELGNNDNKTSDNRVLNPGKMLMKLGEFQKFMKGAEFQKFMKSGADFQKFAKDAAFQKFMKGAEFQKFMKGAEFQKFAKGAVN